MNPIILKFLKYCIVGFSGMSIDFSTTWILKEKVKTNRYVANSVGFSAAAIFNYLLNKAWTFHSDNKNVTLEFATFMGIAIIGLLINNFIVYLLNEKLNLNFYFSKLIAICIVTIWNFLMNNYFTFALN